MRFLSWLRWLWPRPDNQGVTDSPLITALYRQRQCPDCGCKEFNMGPHGGCAQNIKCANCAAEFNVGPFDDGWLGYPMLCERIRTFPASPHIRVDTRRRTN
jgi:hypothetical protein